MTHICVSELTIIGSDNGLSPDRRQAIIWTNAGILLIRPWETNFSEISIEILTFSFKKMRLKVSSAKWRPFCLNVLTFLIVVLYEITWTNNERIVLHCIALHCTVLYCTVLYCTVLYCVVLHDTARNYIIMQSCLLFINNTCRLAGFKLSIFVKLFNSVRMLLISPLHCSYVRNDILRIYRRPWLK